jgi:hypothetical protein
MFGDAYPYKEGEITILPENDILKWCKEKTKGKDPLLSRDLFMYKHNLHGTFVIAQWIGGNIKDLYIDILNLGQGLGSFQRDLAEEFLRRALEPMTAEDMSRLTAASEQEFLRERQEDNDAETERRAKVTRGE